MSEAKQLDISLETAYKYLPEKFAKKASRGQWQEFDFITYLSAQIVPRIFEGNARIVLSVHPRAGKSEFISHWLPTWYLNLFPKKRVALASYESSLAVGFGKKVRDQIKHNEFVSTDLSDHTRASAEWKTTEGGGMVSTGVGGPLTGKGFDLGIIDDPLKGWKEAQSETMRKHLKDWFDTVFYTRTEPNASIIVLATRWHEDDLSGYLVNEHEDNWLHINLHAIAREKCAMGRKPGTPLCPERFTTAQLEQKRRGMGARKYAALYDGEPAPAEGIMFFRSWWRFFDEPPALDYYFQSWDLSFDNISDDSAYNVGFCIGVKGANLYILDRVREQLNFPGQIRAIKAFRKKWPECREVLIEKAANGAAAISTLKDKIPSIIAIIPRESKEIRAAAASPMVESHNVYLPKNAEWTEDCIEEHATFPNSKYKDQVDALSQAINRFLKMNPLIGMPDSMKKVSDFNNL